MAVLDELACPEVAVEEGPEQLGRLFDQQLAYPGMLAPQQALAVVVAFPVAPNRQDVFEQHVCEMHLTLNDCPHDRRDHRVVHVNLERRKDALASRDDVQSPAELVGIACSQRFRHQIASRGDDVDEDCRDVAVYVGPGALDLLVPVLRTGAVREGLQQHLPEDLEVFRVDV
eukprot:scaffold41002_cov35-Prasinocladus_malaysianus.AAC.2